MAILTSASGLITAAQTVETLDGKIQLQFGLASGETRLVTVDSNKLADVGFGIPAAGSERFEGFRILGSGHMVATEATGATAASYGVHLAGQTTPPAANDVVTNGVGKVDFESSSDNDDQLRNIKNISAIIGHAFAADAYTMDTGSIIFSTAGTSSVTVNTAGTSISGTSIVGGTGIGHLEVRETFSENAQTPAIPAGTGPRQLTFTFTPAHTPASVTTVTSSNAAVTAASGAVVDGDITITYTLSAVADGGISGGLDFRVTYVGNDDSEDHNLRLDEQSYPFTLTATESIEAVGSSLIFT